MNSEQNLNDLARMRSADRASLMSGSANTIIKEGVHLENPRRFTRKSPGVAVAAALATGTVTVFAALGGVGVAQSAISAVQYQYGAKVTICHKGKTITVSKNAVPAHVRKHGDTLGPCTSAAAKAKAAKAAKVKAAKAKAEKAHAEKPQTEKPNAQKGEKPGKGKGRGK